MKPIWAAAICLMLGSSSVSSRDAADPLHPVRKTAIHQAVLTGRTIPGLTGLGATLALVLVK